MPTTTAMTNTLESALINLILNGTGYTAGQVTYIGILSAAGSDSAQTEMSGSSRQAIAFGASTSGSGMRSSDCSNLSHGYQFSCIKLNGMLY